MHRCLWTDLQQVGHSGQELGIDSESAVQTVPWLRNQAHGKLMLEHDDCCPKSRPVRQQLERQRRRYLVRNVGHTDVKVWEALFHDIPLYDLQQYTIPINISSRSDGSLEQTAVWSKHRPAYLQVRGILSALHTPLKLRHLHAYWDDCERLSERCGIALTLCSQPAFELLLGIHGIAYHSAVDLHGNDFPGPL